MSAHQKSRFSVKNLVLAAMFTALGILLPMIFTGSIQQYGQMLLPMHLPILLCGFICGPYYGALAGIITPLIKSLLFPPPPFMPVGLAMMFELCAYGFFAGLLYMLFTKKGYILMVYIELIITMVIGRLIWGGVMLTLSGLSMLKEPFTSQMYFASVITGAIPGIVLQLVLIPPLLTLLKRAKYIQ